MKRIESRDVPLPKHRRPFTPGEMLEEEFLVPLGLSQQALAAAIGMDRPSVNSLLRGRRAVTPRTALRLERALGVSAQFWLNLQQDVDLWDAIHDRELRSDLDRIKRIDLRTRPQRRKSAV
ncbi:MAG: HigA family addiction module antitoxin [Vulcanimicrobiaceae bacterium]